MGWYMDMFPTSIGGDGGSDGSTPFLRDRSRFGTPFSLFKISGSSHKDCFKINKN